MGKGKTDFFVLFFEQRPMLARIHVMNRVITFVFLFLREETKKKVNYTVIVAEKVDRCADEVARKVIL